MLKISARDLIREKEPAYNENKLGNENLSEKQLIDAMVKNPILIERPIVLSNGNARIGRPPENILEII